MDVLGEPLPAADTTISSLVRSRWEGIGLRNFPSGCWIRGSASPERGQGWRECAGQCRKSSVGFPPPLE